MNFIPKGLKLYYFDFIIFNCPKSCFSASNMCSDRVMVLAWGVGRFTFQ